MNQTTKLFLTLVAAAALTACGGGGGGDSSPAPTPTPTPTPTPGNGTQTTETEVESRTAPCTAGHSGEILQERTNTRIRTDYTTGEPTFSAWTYGEWITVSNTCNLPQRDDGTLDTPTYTGQKLDGFSEINRVRTLVGLEPLKQNTKLDVAAQGHADYSTLNNVFSHTQTVGNPGFTGVTPQNRATAAGYLFDAAEGVGYGGTVFQKVQEQINTVYHRVWVLDSRLVDIGIGQNSGSYRPTVFLSGYGSYKVTGHAPIVWPIDGAVNTPTRFNSGVGETPDPAPDLGAQNTGYPLSINLPGDKSWTTDVTFTLTCSGQPVTARLLTKHTDKVNSENFWPNFAFLLPEAPLPQNSSCTATFSGSYNAGLGTVTQGTISKTWSFSTGNV